MTDKSKILDKIRKVLAKAEGTNNPHEAEMLMTKVQSMLDEHNLEMLDIAAADSDDPMGTFHKTAHCWVSNSWQKHVAGALARLYGCRIVTAQHKNKIYFSISGRESGRVTWQLMLPFVLRQVREQAKELHAADRAAMFDGRPAQGGGVGTFERAVGNALAFRIWAMVKAAEEADANRVAKGERALVPVDMVEAEMRRAFPNMRDARASTLRTNTAAKRAADGVSLHRQTGGAAVKRIGK